MYARPRNICYFVARGFGRGHSLFHNKDLYGISKDICRIEQRNDIQIIHGNEAKMSELERRRPCKTSQCVGKVEDAR